MELYEEQQYRQDELARNAENSARLAQVFHKAHTTGQGSFIFKGRVDFGLTYTEEPFMFYGNRVDINELADQLHIGGNSRQQIPLPLCTGMVTDWDTDDRGFYTGCWVAVRVYFPTPLEIHPFQPYPPDPGTIDMAFPALGPNEVDVPVTNVTVPVEHYFTFSAVALKDVPINQND